jgi:hypothetical protein
MPKSYRYPTSSIPHFPWPQSVVRTVPYGPKIATENLKITSKICQKSPRFSCQIHTAIKTVQNPTDCTDPYSTSSHNRTKILAKNHKIFSRESCPLSSKNVPSLLLTFLSQDCSENLSNSPPNVLSRHSTCLAHYPIHSFII